MRKKLNKIKIVILQLLIIIFSIFNCEEAIKKKKNQDKNCDIPFCKTHCFYTNKDSYFLNTGSHVKEWETLDSDFEYTNVFHKREFTNNTCAGTTAQAPGPGYQNRVLVSRNGTIFDFEEFNIFLNTFVYQSPPPNKIELCASFLYNENLSFYFTEKTIIYTFDMIQSLNPVDCDDSSP